MMNRRDLLRRGGLAALAVGAAQFPIGWTHAADDKKKHVLMYTRSEGYQHSVVERKGDKLSLAETIVTDLGKKHGFEVVCEKDGRVFESNEFPKFDGFFFETQGNLLSEKSKDGQPPMTAEGKKALLMAVAEGKGFAGCHCASDTFHSPGPKDQNQDPDKIDPYIKMAGGEFIVHGAQQRAVMRVIDPNFPGLKGYDLTDFGMNEEWYALKNFSPDLHVILVQDSAGMKGTMYERPEFPATWARMHEKGRVFYTSMGHRENVWQSKIFQDLLLGGLSWALGNVTADIKPNLEKAAPKAKELPQKK
jgi:type 1 glutamine amidotransferase